MKAIIVAGGRGERLRPITVTKPKPMVEVAGKPILLHTVELLRSAGITEFIFALCYLPDVVKNYFGDGSKFGVSIEYTLEDPSHPLGTAGAIKASEQYINNTFIVTYADILRELDVEKMIKLHKDSQAFATMNVYKRFGKDPKSLVKFDRENKVSTFIERPTEEENKENFVWCNGSFYIFEPQIYEYIPDNSHCDFGKEIFPKLISDNKPVYAFPSEGFFIDIGTKEKLQKAEEAFKTISS
jgi:mannose-1-phosphate guanylyltransferase/phosphomannomutase